MFCSCHYIKIEGADGDSISLPNMEYSLPNATLGFKLFCNSASGLIVNLHCSERVDRKLTFPFLSIHGDGLLTKRLFIRSLEYNLGRVCADCGT